MTITSVAPNPPDKLYIDFPDFGECSFIAPCGHGSGVNGQVTRGDNYDNLSRSWVCPKCGLKLEADSELGLKPFDMMVTYPNGDVHEAVGFEW